MNECQGIGCCAEEDVGAAWSGEELGDADEGAVGGTGGVGEEPEKEEAQFLEI